MYRKAVLKNLFKSVAASLVLTSGYATAASKDLESYKWYLLSMPGATSSQVGELFGESLPANEINKSWAAFSYNPSARNYDRLEAVDTLDPSSAFWFIQLTQQPITIDLAELSESPELKISDACPATAGCFEHDLIASGSSTYALLGSPFTESVRLEELRLLTTDGACSEGCTIAEARDAQLTDGMFLGYDAAEMDYVSMLEGSLQPESGYWFRNFLPAGTQGAKLLIPAPVIDPEGEPVPPPAPPAPAPNANLLFSSGFEEGVTLASERSGYQRLNGVELESGFVWDESLNGLWGSSNNGIHIIDGGGDEGGIENDIIENVPGPDGEPTRALFQEIEFSSGSPRAQTPYQINNIEDDPDEYYISYWMKIDETSLDEDDQWRIIWQYKTDHFDYQSPKPGYRISVFIYTDEDGPYWHVQGDDQDPKFWSVSNRDLPVPRDEWFQVEVYSKVSSGDDGRFWAKINGVEIASQDGPNLGSDEDTMEFMMLWQLYGNSYPASQLVDDVQIWDGVPY